MSHFSINITINESLYLRDPQMTKLGKKIIENSVLLIDECGIEHFTFKKLAERIESTETSIYRYFENKHNLFVYLLNWYWEWMMVRIELNTMNIDDPWHKLKIVLKVMIDTANRNTDIEFVDEEALHRIVVTEGPRGYHHKLIDEDNQDKFFHSYKRLCAKIGDVIKEVNSNFEYPISLASTLIETANNQIYFAKHLPRLTDLRGENDKALLKDLHIMLLHFSEKMLQKNIVFTGEDKDKTEVPKRNGAMK